MPAIGLALVWTVRSFAMLVARGKLSLILAPSPKPKPIRPQRNSLLLPNVRGLRGDPNLSRKRDAPLLLKRTLSLQLRLWQMRQRPPRL